MREVPIDTVILKLFILCVKIQHTSNEAVKLQIEHFLQQRIEMY